MTGGNPEYWRLGCRVPSGSVTQLQLFWDATHCYRVTLLIRDSNPSEGHRRVVGIVLLSDPRRARFLTARYPCTSLFVQRSDRLCLQEVIEL